MGMAVIALWSGYRCQMMPPNQCIRLQTLSLLPMVDEFDNTVSLVDDYQKGF